MQSTATTAEQQSGTRRFEARAYGADLTAKGEPLKRRLTAHACTYVAFQRPIPHAMQPTIYGTPRRPADVRLSGPGSELGA
jgi:hypothetical protein